MKKSLTLPLSRSLMVVAIMASSATIRATELEHAEIAQAIRQLEAAKTALLRAQELQSRSKARRLYLDYHRALNDIALIKQGLDSYLNPKRSEIRNPNDVQPIGGDYLELRNDNE